MNTALPGPRTTAIFGLCPTTSPVGRGGDLRPRQCHRPRWGIGMVELLFALSICASLLTATAVAVDAAFRAYHVNQEQAVLLGKARVSLASMTTSIRGTKLHAPNDATLRAKFALGQTVTDSALVMYDLNDQLLKYQFDPATKRLLVTNPTGTYTLARGVEAFTVTLEPMRSAESVKTGGGWDLLKRATMTLTVKAAGAAAPGEVTGNQTITLSGSVMPRRNAW
jgi:hypothetical protein